MSWIKVDAGITRNPKFLNFVARLKLEPRDGLWNLYHLWGWCSEYYPHGVLKDINDQTIALAALWAGEAKGFVTALIDSGFIDREPGQLVLHDWVEWRPEWVRSRDRRTTGIRPETDRDPTSTTPSSSPVVLSFPVSGNTKSWELREDLLLRLQDLYPGTDVGCEAKKALFWIESNPSKKKTARGMQKFLASWLERTQNRGGSRGQSPADAAETKRKETEAAFERAREHRRKIDAIIDTARASGSIK